MPKMKVYSFKEGQRIVYKNGWKLVRMNGDHFYYKKEGNPRLLTLSLNLNRMIWQRLIKEFDINLNCKKKKENEETIKETTI